MYGLCKCHVPDEVGKSSWGGQMEHRRCSRDRATIQRRVRKSVEKLHSPGFVEAESFFYKYARLLRAGGCSMCIKIVGTHSPELALTSTCKVNQVNLYTSFPRLRSFLSVMKAYISLLQFCKRKFLRIVE